MDEYIVDLLAAYKRQLDLIATYNNINGQIKEYVASKGGKAIVNKYRLNLVKVDKSTYEETLIPYLLENNWDSFLEYKIDNLKIKKSISDKLIDRDYVINNIDRDKTVLDILIPDMKAVLDLDKINEKNMSSKINHRILLKNEVKIAKSIYYEKAKMLKDILKSKELNEYRFKYNDMIGLFRVRIKDRVYSDEFIRYCTEKQIDIFKCVINDSKLRSTKIKSVLNDEVISSLKVERYQDYLYIKKL